MTSHIAKLLFLYLRGGLTLAEERELNLWRTKSPENEELFDKVTDEDSLRQMLKDYDLAKKEVWEQLTKKIPDLRPQVVHRRSWKWTGVVASLVALVVCGTIWYWLERRVPLAEKQVTSAGDVPPGGNRAVLTLASGAKIFLDSVAVGHIGDESGTSIIKSDSGLIEYKSDGKPNEKTDSEIHYNVLSTPRGGQFAVVLPDGSRVWLNAASSLRYPEEFKGKIREVELTGEAYFEVSHNARFPFRVRIGEMTIEDIGTSFDVNAYADEVLAHATLLQGSVKIIQAGEINAHVLTPGDEASWGSSGIKIAKSADTADIVAWKNGMTTFKDADVPTIMRVIKRWYDVEVAYQGQVPSRRITGGIPRNTNLSELLKVLKLYNVNCHLEQKKLTIMP